MKLIKEEFDIETGFVLLTYIRDNPDDFLVDGVHDFNLPRRHSVDIRKGQKDKLVDALGQTRADAIEAQYWSEE